MLGPIVVSLLPRHISKLLYKIVSINSIGLLQHGRYRDSVLFFHLPYPRGTSVLTRHSIGHIKYIPKTRPITRIIYKSNALGATPNVATHFVIPQLIFSTGSSIWPLGINHQLFMERILIKSSSGCEKGCPLPPAAHKLNRYLFRHLPEEFSLRWHSWSFSFHYG